MLALCGNQHMRYNIYEYIDDKLRSSTQKLLYIGEGVREEEECLYLCKYLSFSPTF